MPKMDGTAVLNCCKPCVVCPTPPAHARFLSFDCYVCLLVCLFVRVFVCFGDTRPPIPSGRTASLYWWSSKAIKPIHSPSAASLWKQLSFLLTPESVEINATRTKKITFRCVSAPHACKKKKTSSICLACHDETVIPLWCACLFICLFVLCFVRRHPRRAEGGQGVPPLHPHPEGQRRPDHRQTRLYRTRDCLVGPVR